MNTTHLDALIFPKSYKAFGKKEKYSIIFYPLNLIIYHSHTEKFEKTKKNHSILLSCASIGRPQLTEHSFRFSRK